VDWWGRMLMAVIADDSVAGGRLIAASGLLSGADAMELALVYGIFRTLYEPYRKGSRERFDKEYIQRTWRAFVVDNPVRFKLRLKSEFMVLSQMQWGLSALLARLGTHENWHDRIRRVLDRREV